MRPVPLAIAAVEARVFRYPLDTPVRTSFGTMTDRPMLLVGVTDAGDAPGLGAEPDLAMLEPFAVRH